jgi:hypothetical protein
LAYTTLELAKKEDKPKAAEKDSTAVSDADKLAKIKSDTAIKSIADLQKAISKLDAKKSDAPQRRYDKTRHDHLALDGYTPAIAPATNGNPG